MPNEMTERPGGEGALPRCRAGIEGPRPCWRPATERHWRLGAERALCREHARRLELAEETDDWSAALVEIERWVEEAKANAATGHLERLALNLRDEARERYAEASAEAYAAELVAGQGPPEAGQPVLTHEQAAQLTRLILRADSFVNARTALEDLPEDAAEDKWVTVHALVVAAREATEAVDRYKAELGLKD